MGGLGWDWDWDGMDLRVVVGIEHLTVLIIISPLVVTGLPDVFECGGIDLTPNTLSNIENNVGSASQK